MLSSGTYQGAFKSRLVTLRKKTRNLKRAASLRGSNGTERRGGKYPKGGGGRKRTIWELNPKAAAVKKHVLF